MLARTGVETGVDLERVDRDGALARGTHSGRTRAGNADQGRDLPGCEGDDVSYRLGIDVGGTFTDLLLVDEKTAGLGARSCRARRKTSRSACCSGLERICEQAGIDAEAIEHVMHGTTVATNTVLTSTGAKSALSRRRVIARCCRSRVPSCRAASAAGSSTTSRCRWRRSRSRSRRTSASDARGDVVRALDEAALRDCARKLKTAKIEALTVSLINAFANDAHERRIREIARGAAGSPGVAVLRGRARDAGVRAHGHDRREFLRAARVQRYVHNLQKKLAHAGRAGEAAHPALGRRPRLGGLGRGVPGQPADVRSCGRRHRRAVGRIQAGFPNLLTVDVGGTSTDVALIMNGVPRLRRETTVGDVTVRASSVDIRTVGAGGGSIAHVPELTKALRVGPQSAGADPGPAATAAAARSRPSPMRMSCSATSQRCSGSAAISSSIARSPRKPWQDRRGARQVTRGRRPGHLRHRQREHGRRAAAGLRRAGPRSARLRPDRFRRCGAPACECAVAAARFLARDHSAGTGRALRARRCDDGAARRIRAHLHPQVRRNHAAEIAQHPRPAVGDRRDARSSARKSRPPTCSADTRSTCATTARACA